MQKNTFSRNRTNEKRKFYLQKVRTAREGWDSRSTYNFRAIFLSLFHTKTSFLWLMDYHPCLYIYLCARLGLMDWFSPTHHRGPLTRRVMWISLHFAWTLPFCPSCMWHEFGSNLKLRLTIFIEVQRHFVSH